MESEQTFGISKPLEARLHGNMSTLSLMLTVLAFAAPIAVVTGFIPLTFVYGGRGSVAALLLTMLLILTFSVGFVAMARLIPRPGAFYTYVTAGLGRVVGLAGAFLTTASYYLLLIGGYAVFGVLASHMIETFGGPNTPWIWSAIAGWLITSILGYFHIELSARVLSVAMVLEVALILLFDAVTLFKTGFKALPLDVFTPTAFLQGNVPVTLAFCVLMFTGFEATAVFRDEVRNPEKTIPRATFGAVIFIGVLHALSAYCLLIAFGEGAVAAAKADPTAMFPKAIGHTIAPVFSQITSVVVVISQFAAGISVHNVTTRYFHTLAADHALPRYLAAVHPRHNSPYRASVLVAILIGVPLLFMSTLKNSSELLYSQLMGVGLIGLMTLMALVSLAVIIWFVREGRPHSVSIWQAYAAPAIALLGMSFITVMAYQRFGIVFGGDTASGRPLFALIFGAFAGGLLLALYYRFFQAGRFSALGGGLLSTPTS